MLKINIKLWIYALIFLTACSSASVTATASASPPTPPVTLDAAPLVFVPAGEFTMGGDLTPEEKPIHKVTLNAFWIDQFEITNALYRKCVAAQKCKAPVGDFTGRHEDGYYSNLEFDTFPAVYVAWEDSRQYCAWAGKRLPTEAEWEKAARGVDERIFPWGNTFDDGKRSNSALRGELVTTAAGTYPNGASPYGAQDMAGNVWEWVADWYDGNYYAVSPVSNPPGPATGTLKILRGGGYGGYDMGHRTTLRRGNAADESTAYIGFRCALSAP